MSDTRRRISKLEEKITPQDPLSGLSIKKLKRMALDYASIHFGRKLSKSEYERMTCVFFQKKMKLDEITEKDLLPTSPK